MELSKGTWLDRQHDYPGESVDDDLKETVDQIIDEPPGYGYRPMLVELEDEYGITVNYKRLRRLLNTWDIAL